MEDLKTDEMILESISKTTPGLSEKDKKLQLAILKKILTGEQSLQQALGLNKDVMEFFYSQGHKMYQMKKYEDALRFFNLLFFINPLDPRFSLAIAASYQMNKQYDEAIQWYFTLYLLDGKSPLPFYYISDCCIKKLDNQAAVVFLKKVVEIAGDVPEYSGLKERAFRMIGPLEKTLEPKTEKSNL